MKKLTSILFTSKLVFALVILLALASSASAHYTQTCKIKYKKSDGKWSEYYRVDVKFMYGSELNTSTNSYKYASYSVYATIFFSKDQVVIIKLDNYMGCGSEIDTDCINGKYSNFEGKDQDERNWEIYPKSRCS